MISDWGKGYVTGLVALAIINEINVAGDWRVSSTVAAVMACIVVIAVSKWLFPPQNYRLPEWRK